ncbi:MAG: hypothetical protein E7347_02425 [Clostridiales bacterium]|nr:hypothetical protein [Clostridiales bacterium]
MVNYFKEEQYEQAKKQRKETISLYIGVMVVYALVSIGLFVWYTTLPYMSPTINTIKWIHYPLTAIIVLFSFIYLGIKYKRVNRYYKLIVNLMTGLRETSTGSFIEVDESLQEKDGVDFKALIFLEWNKFKNDFFERKVLIFDELEVPEFKENQNVRYVTQGNVLVSYEILDLPVEE